MTFVIPRWMHVSVKGYLRKAANLLAMKEYTKATNAYEKVMEMDPNCQVSVPSNRPFLSICDLSQTIMYYVNCEHCCDR